MELQLKRVRQLELVQGDKGDALPGNQPRESDTIRLSARPTG
jgi:hypothetical protein